MLDFERIPIGFKNLLIRLQELGMKFESYVNMVEINMVIFFKTQWKLIDVSDFYSNKEMAEITNNDGIQTFND